ncbi:hypothetical protein AB0H43_27510 [Hamadaea sp. NPDC050747]|uniref:hypothetical protein n=1 Tax=Hamadaea sp. NPDC050747 TaxID=3155789 RepID=UPI0033D21562
MDTAWSRVGFSAAAMLAEAGVAIETNNVAAISVAHRLDVEFDLASMMCLSGVDWRDAGGVQAEISQAAGDVWA